MKRNTLMLACVVLICALMPRVMTAQAVRHSTPEVSPDGQQILFVLNDGEQSDILVVNRDGTNITRLTETPNRNEHSARWSPEGDRVVYVARGDTENALFVLHLSTNTSSKVVEGSGIQTPSWSPDGLSIVYAAGAFPQLDIYSRDLTRSIPDRISREGGFIHTPLVSPDGSRIAFVAARLPADSGPRIYVMNADGSAEHPVSSSEWLAERPAWSPDGDWIAFQALSRPSDGGARTATLRIVRPDGTDGRAVAAHDRPFLDESPSWFPDGRRIAFQSDRNGEMRIYVLDIDDGSVRQVTR